MAIATNMGIIAMLVVVAGVLSAFASFFIYLMRRAKIVAAQEASEGTAQ
jgi:maltodextrin utilization protein YvdJ